MGYKKHLEEDLDIEQGIPMLFSKPSVIASNSFIVIKRYPKRYATGFSVMSLEDEYLGILDMGIEGNLKSAIKRK